MPAVEAIDGRTARRNRNKDAVLDALIQMAARGNAEPPIEDIAERAGVSYRSVYRYFEDRTDLMLSAIARVTGDAWQIFDVAHLGQGSLDDRILGLVAVRLSAYHQVAPLAGAAVRLRANEPAVAEGYDRLRDHLRGQLAAQFEPELSALPVADQALVLASLDAMFQFEALDYLVKHHALGDTVLSRLLARHIRIHLTA